MTHKATDGDAGPWLRMDGTAADLDGTEGIPTNKDVVFSSSSTPDGVRVVMEFDAPIVAQQWKLQIPAGLSSSPASQVVELASARFECAPRRHSITGHIECTSPECEVNVDLRQTARTNLAPSELFLDHGDIGT